LSISEEETINLNWTSTPGLKIRLSRFSESSFIRTVSERQVMQWRT